jgi:UDPglucose 6-dehydrogenase
VNICMIGAGYVGLVSAACFSNFGWHVHCIDNNQDKIDLLNQGKLPIYEPGLDELVERNVKAGRLSFSTNMGEAVSQADLIFLAVGTPMRRGDGYADLTYVYQAVSDLAPYLDGYTVLTTKSTVPVGTSREIEKRLRELRPDASFSVCSNPEFLREGSAIQDFTHPDRVLVGADNDRARSVMERVYEPLRLRNAPVIFVGRESAELAKYAANAFLAMKISFINEISDLCEEVGADVQQVATAIGSDGRIGEKFLHPGPGYGGSCFPKDVSALVRTGREARTPLSLVEQVEKVNMERKIAMTGRIERAAGGDVRGKVIAILGMTFKPNTDDMREAPSLVIVPMLLERGAIVRAYDPQGRSNAQPMLPATVTWCDQALEAALGADILVILTEWNEFRALNLTALKERMRGRIIVDLRNVMRPDYALSAGFVYHGVGRPNSKAAPVIAEVAEPVVERTVAENGLTHNLAGATGCE